MDYARRYRAVLRYEIEGRRQSGRAERQTVYGKVFAGNIGALAGSGNGSAARAPGEGQ